MFENKKSQIINKALDNIELKEQQLLMKIEEENIVYKEDKQKKKDILAKLLKKTFDSVIKAKRTSTSRSVRG